MNFCSGIDTDRIGTLYATCPIQNRYDITIALIKNILKEEK
jgi:hypothetical protein